MGGVVSREARKARKDFFFGKKEAKNVCPFGARWPPTARPTENVFLLLFLQKKKSLPT
jgi:hypothetical protein